MCLLWDSFREMSATLRTKDQGLHGPIYQKLSKTTASNRSQPHRGFVNLPCIQGTSVEMIATTLNQFNINVAREPQITIGSIKQKFCKDLSSRAFYKINCKACDKVNISQTSTVLRSLLAHYQPNIACKTITNLTLAMSTLLIAIPKGQNDNFLEARHSIR